MRSKMKSPGRAMPTPVSFFSGIDRRVRYSSIFSRAIWATSAGVLAGLGLAWATGIWVLDPLLAAIVAVNVLWIGWKLIRGSVGGLMDESLDGAELDRLRRALEAAMSGAIEIHDLRTRRAGWQSFVEFHLIVPGTLSVEDAHRICDRIEAKLREAISDVQISIHVEPADKAKHSGIVVV